MMKEKYVCMLINYYTFFHYRYSAIEIKTFKKKGALSRCTKAKRSILTPYVFKCIFRNIYRLSFPKFIKFNY